MITVRLYYINHLLNEWLIPDRWIEIQTIMKSIKDQHGLDVYNGGFLAVQSEWYRCDGIPAGAGNVPKELLIQELINPP